MSEKTYKYDAFISYRHLENDSFAARNLQKLLEGYKTPRGAVCRYATHIDRLFLDETELSANGDLNNEIKGALEQSRFLIVVCSEETKKSKWCMQEIDYFKSLHNNHLDNILTILVSGDPNEAFPDSLRIETKESVDKSGNIVSSEYEVEPLAANISSESKQAMLKKLKKEYLRLAAAILGCEFDSLYDRHKRRIRRNAALIGAASVLALSSVGIILNHQFAKIEESKAEKLYDTAVALIQDADNGEYQKALYNLAESAKCRYPKEKYQDDTIYMALKNSIYPVEAEALEGKILDGTAIVSSATANGYDEVIVSEYAKQAIAVNAESGRFLLPGDKDSFSVDNGDLIENVSFIASCSKGRYWVFAPKATQNHTLIIYDSEQEAVYSLDLSAEDNHLSEIEQYNQSYMSVDICENYASVTSKGYLYLYTPGENSYVLSDTISYKDLLTHKETAYTTPDYVVLSPGTDYAAIDTTMETIILYLPDHSLAARIPNNGSLVSDFFFTDSGSKFLITYGSPMNVTEGRAELYSLHYNNGKYELIHQRLVSKPLAEAVFSEDDEVFIARDFSNGIYITTTDQRGKLLDYPPMYMTNKIKAVTGGRDFAFAVSANEGSVHFIDVVSQKEKYYPVGGIDTAYRIVEIHPTEDKNLALLSKKCLKITDLEGNVKESHYFDSEEYYNYAYANRYEFQENFTLLDTPWGAWDSHDFPGTEELKKTVNEQLAKYLADNKIPLNSDSSFLGICAKVSRDEQNIYVMSSLYPSLCEFKKSSDTSAEFTYGVTFTTEMPVDLFIPQNGKQIAVSTISGNILIYNLPLSSDIPKTITPEVFGEIREIRIDESGKFMAISTKLEDSYAMELWDIENSILLDVKNDGKSLISGLCFYDNKIYYSVGEYLCSISLSSGDYSKKDYEALVQLSGVVKDESGETAYRVPKKDYVIDKLSSLNITATSDLSLAKAIVLPFDEKFSEVFQKTTGKTNEEIYQLLMDNKEDLRLLFTNLSQEADLTNYYGSLIQYLVKEGKASEAKAIQAEYFDTLASVICKSVYEWTSSDRAADLRLLHYPLSVAMLLPDDLSAFTDFLSKVSAYASDSVNTYLTDIIDNDPNNYLLNSAVVINTLTNDCEYLSYAVKNDVAGLEKDLEKLGYTEILPEDEGEILKAKLLWLVRLSLLQGNGAKAAEAEKAIFSVSEYDYDIYMYKSWLFFSDLKKHGIITESAFDEYYNALKGMSDSRDHMLMQ